MKQKVKRRSDAIIGAIGGDIIGSVYEFKGARGEEIQFFKEGCTFTDDTVLTVALADWATKFERPVQDYLLKYARKYQWAGYGSRFVGWMHSSNPRPYNSCGNGSAMRVSAVGCKANTVFDAIHLAEVSAQPTHNHPEGIKGAQAVAVAVFLAREKSSKEEIKNVLKSRFDYDLDRSYQDLYDADYSFNVLCQNTVPEALICFFESDSYENCIRRAMLTNKDTDTAASIAGAVAAAYYGISDEFREKVLSYLPDEFREVIAEFDKTGEAKKRVVYLHGFGSSGQSGTVEQLRKLLPDYDVLAPDIPVAPSEALPFLKNYCYVFSPSLIIGTSMGAMYAMQMHDYKRICVNPALRMSQLTDILKPGTFEYFQPTKSGETHFTITEDIIQQFREMEAHLFDEVNDENRRWCWGFFGDEDTTVNCKEEFQRQYFPNVHTFHGAHRMNNRILEQVIVPFVRMLLDEEKTDEWGVTYSSYGRILKSVDNKKFTCEEYTIPEGVEVMEGDFMYSKKLRKVHLPSTLRIMECNAFIHCPLEELELPDGMEEVPGCMCECCEKLKKVELPTTIENIGICAFNGCFKLEEINLPDSLEYVEDGVFRFCESLKHVTLPSELKVVSPEMFYCSGIETIEIPESVEKIGYWAFWGCKKLKRLVIPESVTYIDYGIVSANESFEGVECHAKGYHVENDALIEDKSHTMLCCWTKQKHYMVPECVRRIADFGGNEFVETITAKQPIELTTGDEFASDINLKRVDFQGGVTGISGQTFYNCPNLEE